MPSFGLRLRRLRRAKNVKQAALADLLGVDQATVSRWESGSRSPLAAVQHRAFDTLGPLRSHDAALRRLVERSADCVHLVDEASHVCLAYSPRRARDWGTTPRAMLGVSLWRFATDDIRRAEAELVQTGWWEVAVPPPKAFVAERTVHGEIRISAGTIVWERVYLADGTPARLVSGDGGGAGLHRPVP
jgi:DNA-binding XRE family transcriptional regulator